MPAETAQTFRRVELPDAEYIFGSTAGMFEIQKKIDRALQDDLPVLIEGESGTGKEVIGRFLHTRSAYRDGPFVKVNCGAVPVRLLEAEMFGYETSAGGDVRETRNGSIGMASGGTLFLDEIGDMDLALQQKLARTLASGYYGRQDGREDVTVNTRFVCATSINLEDGLRNQTFLEELLGRFSFHRVRLLPLRERKEDIPQLCKYLVGKFARDFGRPVPDLSPEALEAFQQWKWPGNIRELENWIARIVIFGTEEAIGLEFNRQLLALEEPRSKHHRATHVKLGRTRRLRRHS